MAYVDTRDAVAVAAVGAIHTGEVDRLRQLLDEHPGLATDRLGSATGMSRTLLHVVTDWPGHLPRGAETVRVLVQAGADVNARFAGPHIETPLHWAASTDDVPVLDALIDAGADIEAPGAVIGGGTPISDACAFAQWNAARRLLERGATTQLWESAALGVMDRIEAAFSAEPPPDAHEVTQGLWSACHGDQREAAEYFLDRGAGLDWIGYDDLTPLDAATRAGAADLAAWLRARGAKSAHDLR